MMDYSDLCFFSISLALLGSLSYYKQLFSRVQKQERKIRCPVVHSQTQRSEKKTSLIRRRPALCLGQGLHELSHLSYFQGLYSACLKSKAKHQVDTQMQIVSNGGTIWWNDVTQAGFQHGFPSKAHSSVQCAFKLDDFGAA